jgi:GNAT superfamily N-acetyltransferase
MPQRDLIIRIVNTEPRYAEALEQLQRDCFPFLAEAELMRSEHFLHHCRLFPEGEFVALADVGPAGEALPEPRVVGLGSGFFIDFDFEHPDHGFREIVGGGYYRRHDPEGRWYYGADISVHPDYRGRGIGRRLYRARQDLVRRRGRCGIVAGGALPGYERYRDALTVAEYAERVAAGELRDPTLSFQLANDFELRGMLEGYIEDEITGSWATLIVWENPDADC